MEETTATEEAQEAQEDRETPAERRTLERRAEATEDSPPEREEYQPQTSERTYSKKAEYKKSQKETSSKKSGLELKVMSNKSGAVFSHGTILHSMGGGQGAEKVVEESYDMHDGINYVPMHYDPETGEIYFSVEIKTASYRLIEARGKLALHGETGRVGESFLETVVRGIIEENPNSHGVLLKALKETGEVYDRTKIYVDSVPSESYIIPFWVGNRDEWQKFVRDINPEAPKVIMSLTEFSKTKRSDWAFDHYNSLAGILQKNLERGIPKKESSFGSSHFMPMNYSKPIGQYSFN